MSEQLNYHDEFRISLNYGSRSRAARFIAERVSIVPTVVAIQIGVTEAISKGFNTASGIAFGVAAASEVLLNRGAMQASSLLESRADQHTERMLELYRQQSQDNDYQSAEEQYWRSVRI